MIPKIPAEMLRKIFRQAEQNYPSETCGMILGPEKYPKKLTVLRPCVNVQDVYHEKDPENFPRTSRTAYWIDPKELLQIHKQLREEQLAIRIIYHSHIDVGAYFSDEDKRAASPDGDPAYPNVVYLVVAVRNGRAQEGNLFHWENFQKDFVLLEKVSPSRP